MMSLIHSFPVHPFPTPSKYQKTLRFSDVFTGKRKGALGTNGLSLSMNATSSHRPNSFLDILWVSENKSISSTLCIFITYFGQKQRVINDCCFRVNFSVTDEVFSNFQWRKCGCLEKQLPYLHHLVQVIGLFYRLRSNLINY